MLNRLIEDLLFEFDFVVVPGFGAFVGNYRPAQILKSRNSIKPPAKSIAFNSQIKGNDGMLAQRLSRKKDISYNQALSEINETVENWFELLHTEGNFRIQRVGRFHFNESGKIIFSPFYSKNHLADSFGFSEVKLPHSQNSEKPLSKRPVISLQKTRSSYVPSYERKEPSNNWLKVAASLIIVILSGFFIFKMDEFQQSSTLASFSKPSEIIEPSELYKQDTEKEETPVSEEIVENGQNAKQAIEASILPEEISTDKFNESGHKIDWFIIGGAFKDRSNAASFSNQIKRKGYEGIIKDTKKGFYRVSYNVFNDSTQAAKVFNHIKKNENSSAWILKEE